MIPRWTDIENTQVMLKLHHVLHCSVIAFDFALGLRMIRSASGVTHTSIAEILAPSPNQLRNHVSRQQNSDIQRL